MPSAILRARVRLTGITTIATLAPFPATIGSAIGSGGRMYVIVALKYRRRGRTGIRRVRVTKTDPVNSTVIQKSEESNGTNTCGYP